MGDQANLAGRMAVGLAAQLGLLLHVVQTETGFVAPASGRYSAADQRIGATGFPVGVRRRAGFAARQAGRVDKTEQAAAFEIGTHHQSQRLTVGAVTAKIGDGHRNPVGASASDFDRQLGQGGQRGSQKRCRQEHGSKVHRKYYSREVVSGQ